MKKIINKFLSLLYDYYNDGSTQSIAYEKSIITLILVLFLNIYSILVYTGIEDKYLSFSTETPMWQKYLIVLLSLLPIYYSLKRIFKKEIILRIRLDKPSKRRGYIIIIGYILASMIILTLIIQNK
jgi:hypothetical protein